MNWKDEATIMHNQGADIAEILRYIEINEMVPIKSELFTKTKLLKEIQASLRNGGYSDNSEFGKLYTKIESALK